ncbi:MAG TPA: response regulator transcription factor [Crinalium sp.]|jgi:DNA-binding NarL/FixJ family response regulator
MQCFKTVSDLSTLNISPLHILIVEANPLMQLKLKQTFAAHPQWQIVGFITHEFEQVDSIELLNPDLVILDADLPGLDSIAVLRSLKSRLPNLRVIILSSDRRESQAVLALRHGANAYCVKESSLKRLLVAIACVQDDAVYLDPHIARGVVKQLETPIFDSSTTVLSKRELEILQLLVAGQTNVEIAKALYLSPHTIKTHVRSIMNKLAVDDRVQVAVAAWRSGLIRSHVA